MADTSKTIVNGAMCTWWGVLGEDNSHTESGLPCCPHCGGVLFQQTEESWWNGVVAYEDAGHPDYGNFIHWIENKCFKTFEDAKKAYNNDPENH